MKSDLTKKQREQIEDMFTSMVSPEEMARKARRFIHENIRMMLQLDDDEYNKKWIEDGHFYLTELCEILDPQLEKEEN